MLDFDPPRGLSGRLNAHIDAPRREQRTDSLGPLDDDHAALFQQLGTANRFEVIGAGDAIRVEMEDCQPAAGIDIQEDKCRAADRARPAAEAPDQAADELRLTGAQVAVKGDAFTAAKRAGKLRGDRFSLLDAVGSMNHAAELWSAEGWGTSGEMAAVERNWQIRPAQTVIMLFQLQTVFPTHCSQRFGATVTQ